MKKIKEMLRQNLGDRKEKKKKRKKDKKEKKGDKDKRKDKKHKRRSSSSEDEERKHRSYSRDDSAAEGNKSRSHHLPGYGLQIPTGRPHQHSAQNSHTGRRERSRSRSPPRNNRENHSHSSYRGDRKAEPRASSPQRERYQRQRQHVSKKLSTEELERKRKAMMDEAKQREEDRENNVKRYKRQDEQEKQQEQNAKRDRHAGFIHNMKLESAASSSLEDRVKRNIHSIQRTPASLDNFMKR